MVTFFAADLAELQKASRVWQDQSEDLQVAATRLRLGASLAGSFGAVGDSGEVVESVRAYFEVWEKTTLGHALAAEDKGVKLAEITGTLAAADEESAAGFRGFGGFGWTSSERGLM